MSQRHTNREMLRAGISDVPHYLVFILLIGITLWAEYAVFSLFIPTGAAILRWSGLAVTEVGAFGWQLYHKNRKIRRSKIQLRWSFVLIWVDVGAAILCAMFELLGQLALHGYGLDTPVVSTIILVLVVIVIGINLIAYFVCFHYSPEHVEWLDAPADEPFVPRGISGTNNVPARSAGQNPQVRVDEVRPPKPSQPQQKQSQLPPPSRGAIPAAGQTQASRGDDKLYQRQQPSQYLPAATGEDEGDFLEEPPQRTAPLPNGAKPQGTRQPYPPQQQSSKKPLPEQQALPRKGQPVMEDIPPKAQREREARDQMVIETETRVLPQRTSPSEQIHWNQ